MLGAAETMGRPVLSPPLLPAPDCPHCDSCPVNPLVLSCDRQGCLPSPCLLLTAAAPPAPPVQKRCSSMQDPFQRCPCQTTILAVKIVRAEVQFDKQVLNTPCEHRL